MFCKISRGVTGQQNEAHWRSGSPGQSEPHKICYSRLFVAAFRMPDKTLPSSCVWRLPVNLHTHTKKHY